MKINAENIEEWMFDFHEGMLPESDKAEVLNFLHMHPEFNNEFAGWAQTHALKNDEIQVPADLLAGILKPTAVPFYLNKFILGTLTGIALTSGILGFLYYQDSAENKKETLTSKPTTTKSITTTSQTITKQIKETIIQTKPNTNKVMSIQENERTKNIDYKEIAKQDSVPELHSHEVKTEAKPEMETLRQDSIPATDLENPVGTEVSKTKETITEKQKKKRGLLPFSVKPQSKFKPANSNF